MSIKTISILAISVVLFAAVGCNKQAGQTSGAGGIGYPTDMGDTIGSVAEIFAPEAVSVQGYAIVGGLDNTGSSECPPSIKVELKKYIKRHLEIKDINKFIRSRRTAVVAVTGAVPTDFGHAEKFDLMVKALGVTQTTSLRGGWLYGVNLKAKQRFGKSLKILAHAKGPVFIDTLDTQEPDEKTGYILGGGTGIKGFKIILLLRKPDYKMAGAIRNLLNMRFGNVAKAVSNDTIKLQLPNEYIGKRQRFISIIRAMYIDYSPEVNKRRIPALVAKLAAATDEDRDYYEVALEAIGNSSIDKLAVLLNSSDQQLRLRSARCILNMGNPMGVETLRQIALDKNSKYRIEAVEAITSAANRTVAAALGRRLLGDEDLDIRIAAYRSLRALDDITIDRSRVGRLFYLEQVGRTPHKLVFVARSGEPRIVLAGAPLHCRQNIFIESEDGSIVINASAGQGFVSVIRKLPDIPAIKLKSSFELADIIRTLCEEPVRRTEKGRIGLGVTYSEVIAILKKMCDKGAVDAEFVAGPMPEIGTR